MKYLLSCCFFTFIEDDELLSDEINVDSINKEMGMISCSHGSCVSGYELGYFAEDFVKRNILTFCGNSKTNIALAKALSYLVDPADVFDFISLWVTEIKLNVYIYYDDATILKEGNDD